MDAGTVTAWIQLVLWLFAGIAALIRIWKKGGFMQGMNLPQKGLYVLLLAGLIVSGVSLYFNSRPRIVEKIVEKPVEKVVEKLVVQECPKCPSVSASTHTKKAPAVPFPQSTQTQSGQNNTQTGPIAQGAGSALSFGQQGGVTGAFTQINPPFDPNAPVITYFENGETRVMTQGKITGGPGPETDAFHKMKELSAAKKWQELLSLCTEQMKQSPKWITPYYYAGWAQGSLGQFDTAIQLLGYVEQQTKGNDDYGNLSERAHGMIVQIETYKKQQH